MYVFEISEYFDGTYIFQIPLGVSRPCYVDFVFRVKCEKLTHAMHFFCPKISGETGMVIWRRNSNDGVL